MNIDLKHGNCLEVMNTIPDGSIDLILTDPPYGTTACKWDSVIDLELMWLQLKRIIKPNGAIVLFGSQPFTSKLISSNYEMFKYEWIWYKNKKSGHLNAKKMPMKFHENIMVFYSRLCVYNPQRTSGHNASNYALNSNQSDVYGKQVDTVYTGGDTTRHPQNVIQIPVINNDNSGEIRLHPTQKPVRLMEYLIKTYSHESEFVLDFTMGSGSTGVACINTNRKFIGIESDYEYFKIATDRIDNHIPPVSIKTNNLISF